MLVFFFFKYIYLHYFKNTWQNVIFVDQSRLGMLLTDDGFPGGAARV